MSSGPDFSSIPLLAAGTDARMAGDGGCPLSYPVQAIRLHARRFEGGYSFPPHTQPMHQFYCVIEGEIRYRVESQMYHLHAGEGLWIAPGLEREPRAVTKKGEYLVVEFTAPWPELGADRGTPCRLDDERMADVRRLAELKNAARDAHLVSILFHYLCLRLLPPEWFQHSSRIGERSGKKTPRSSAEQIERIEQMLAANTGHALGLEEIAALAGMSRSALGRLFMTYRGKSPCARFREIRLDRARQLLQYGGRSVTEAAMETGFTSTQHFADSFKRRFGYPPSVFKGIRDGEYLGKFRTSNWVKSERAA